MIFKKFFVITVAALFPIAMIHGAVTKQKQIVDDEKTDAPIETLGLKLSPGLAELQEHILQNDQVDRQWVTQHLKARITKLAHNEQVLDKDDKFSALIFIFRPIITSDDQSDGFVEYRKEVLNYLLIEAVYYGDVKVVLGLLYYGASPLFICREYEMMTAWALAVKQDNPRLEHLLGVAILDQQESFDFCREIQEWGPQLQSNPVLIGFIYKRIFTTYQNIAKVAFMIAELQESVVPVFLWALMYLKKLAAQKNPETLA